MPKYCAVVMHGETVLAHIAWLPDWGLTLSFRLDGLGLMFSLLILGIGKCHLRRVGIEGQIVQDPFHGGITDFFMGTF